MDWRIDIRDRRDSWTMAALMAISAICLGQAVQVANGNQKPLAIAWLTGAFVCLIAATVDALLAGHNLSAVTMPTLSGASAFYAPGRVPRGRVLVGYPSPPLTLLLSIPGHLYGDYRYTQLAAMTVAAAFMVYARPGILGGVAAAIFLFTPRVFFVLEQGWTDPLCVTMLAATVFAACRVPKLLPYALGLLLAVKQYLIFAVPIGFLLSTDINTFRRYGIVLPKAVSLTALTKGQGPFWRVQGR